MMYDDVMLATLCKINHFSHFINLTIFFSIISRNIHDISR